MRSFRFIDQKAGRVFASLALLLSTVSPTLLPVFATAAPVTERSIQLSSASADANNVTYQVNFTSVGAAGAFVVDFCENSPLYGEDCDTPAGFSATSAASATVGFTDVTDIDSNTIVVAGTIGATTPVSVDITGINNPTADGVLYARIVTFDTDTNADAYVSNPVEPAVNTGRVDDGAVAISITPTIGVSAAVLEALTFCVSAAAITDACVTTTAPTLTLGEDVGDGVLALVPSAISTSLLYTQISTNADGGAVVSLKSSTTCGGLKRAEVAGCDIAPALQTGITAGQAKFGVLTAAASNLDGSSNGTYQAKSGSGYNNSTYAFNWDDNDVTGVTSPYGDPILDTGGDPVNTRNLNLTFGASISNSTPAGRYSTDLSLIATGTF